jgi:hypothetical protein
MKYMIVSDDDGHYYVIPTRYEHAWNAWRACITDDYDFWDGQVPKYADPIGGSPTLVHFDSYSIGEKNEPT